MIKDEFLIEKKYKEAKCYINWEKETDLDNDIKKSLEKYKEINCPNGTDIIGWLEWNAEENMKEMQTRLKNGEDLNQVINDFKDRTKNKFYY